MVLAGGLRFWALDMSLPHPMARPDEEAILAHTVPPARGKFDLEWAVYPSAYVYLTWAWGAAGVKAAAALGALPSGDYLTAYRKHPGTLMLIDRTLSALAGTGAVLLLIVLARGAVGEAGALVGGMLLATDFLHARDSHAIKPDALMSLAVLAAVAAIARLAAGATWRRGALAGLAVGAAMAVKYPAVLLLVPAYAAAVAGSSARGWRRLVPGPALVAGLVAALVFVGTSPYLVFNAQTQQKVLLIVSWVFPQLPIPELRGTPGPNVPSAPPSWEGLVYHLRFSLRYGMGLLPTLLAPCALVWGAVRGGALLRVAAGFVVVYFAVIGSSPAMHARYMTPIIPLLCLLEGALLAAATARLPGRRRAVVLAVAMALLTAEPLASAVGHNRIAARTDTRELATQWMAEHLPRGSRVLVLGTRRWYWGIPRIPPGIHMAGAPPEPGAMAAAGVTHVLTHDHVLFSSRVDPADTERLAPHLELLADFDPFAPGRTDAVFEAPDAYYIPFHGFGGVVRPGPRVRIYAFR